MPLGPRSLGDLGLTPKPSPFWVATSILLLRTKTGAPWTRYNGVGAETALNRETGSLRCRNHIKFRNFNQPMATHDSGHVKSRLDRVYTNHHVCDQIDSRFGCACLDWAPHLSHHRPVVFFRHRPSKSRASLPIDENVIREGSWASNVSLMFQDLLHTDPLGEDPLKKLFLLKQAIKDCPERMSEERKRARQLEQCVLIDDQIGWTMRAIRAIEQNHRGTLLRCVQAYSYIGTLINPCAEGIRAGRGFAALRDHAVKLQKEKLLQELQDIQSDIGQVEEGSLFTRRSRAQFKLNKLKPGNCCTVGAIKSRDGTFLSDPSLIVRELHQYWGEVFSGGSCDARLLRQWIDDGVSLPTWAGFENSWVPSLKDMDRTIY